MFIVPEIFPAILARVALSAFIVPETKELSLQSRAVIDGALIVPSILARKKESDVALGILTVASLHTMVYSEVV